MENAENLVGEQADDVPHASNSLGFVSEQLNNSKFASVNAICSPFPRTFSIPRFLICLAPMVRVGGLAFRSLCLSYGADKVWSEEIIDKRIAACDRIENKQLGTIDFVISASQGNRPDACKDSDNNTPVIFRTDPLIEKNKVIFQIGSSCAEDALAAALKVHNDVAGIDINMGCPKRFSVQGGMGAALLQKPDVACSIISTLRSHLSIPG